MSEGTWTMSDGEFYAELFKAFVAGFKASGEGWNGEYPFDDKDIEVATDPNIQGAFNEWRSTS